ncbi:hypothetical protein [Nostoc sp. TCL240-02]|uniref:hypothetical protein n=1 Tax=Nostoc sp. TCL240-02 TaxID=2572090 RepID=UPI00157FA959|nr:hypothetical protein [Nostoc sp. TCL240-02]QKQ75225.1 hypothetical protein FBB35_19730 [Nostoc sp. TCL240-02]
MGISREQLATCLFGVGNSRLESQIEQLIPSLNLQTKVIPTASDSDWFFGEGFGGVGAENTEGF